MRQAGKFGRKGVYSERDVCFYVLCFFSRLMKLQELREGIWGLVADFGTSILARRPEGREGVIVRVASHKGGVGNTPSPLTPGGGVARHTAQLRCRHS